MGIVLGITGAPEPPFQLLKLPAAVLSHADLIPFEIRRYQPYFVAEVLIDDGEENSGFGSLARFYTKFTSFYRYIN